MTDLANEIRDRLLALPPRDRNHPAVASASEFGTHQLRDLFDAMAGSRLLDFAARDLRAAGVGYYTIGSAGHEPNAAVAAALRPTDPALLHYRSGGFYLTRSMQALGAWPGLKRGLRDVLLGLVGAADEPIAGGRHKVFGRHDLAVIPQTSTIASHLPRALGVAMMVERATKLGVDCAWPEDAVVVASFGDASANHSTALGAINAACNAAYRGLPVPLLAVCEDNGIGISVPTPDGWIASAFGHRSELEYFSADGTDIAACLEAATAAANFVRRRRRPAFLHLRVVRLLGHAGSDAEVAYRTPGEIASSEARDPVVAAGQTLIESGSATPEQVVKRWESLQSLVNRLADQVAGARKLTRVAEVLAPLSPRSPDLVAEESTRVASDAIRLEAFGGKLPELGARLTLAEHINRTLIDVLAARPGALVFGEDVGRKGGVYGVTRGLAKRFGAGRVFDTILDEQSILGLGLGAGVSGLLPIPEIQYLAYLHNAEDQLRGEAASLSFFSSGRYRNPMVVRIAGLAYQKGFGGHFHNDNGVAVLSDIPGLIVAVPSRGDDAAAMLRTCIAAGVIDGAVSAFLEPIALYHSRDLHEAGDGELLSRYTAPEDWAETHIPLGRGQTYGDGHDLTIVSFGNGVGMAMRVAKTLQSKGIFARVLDLRWLSPLPVGDLIREAEATGRVLIVDETRRSGGVSEAVIAALVDHGVTASIARVTSMDSFIPLGDAANLVLLGEAEIEAAALRLIADNA